MRAKTEFRFKDDKGDDAGEIITAVGANLLQCDADATMQFMRKWAAKIRPEDLFAKHTTLIPETTADAAIIEQTQREVASGKVPERWRLGDLPGDADTHSD